MASREHETSAQRWGTSEELLLVCAVNRHGTRSWDSVATEVQRRRNSAATSVLTAQSCRDKFDDLRRRFVSQNNDASKPTVRGGLEAMVDELRRLRVEELRRDLRCRDVSIVSLELKVKRLEEDRDRSVKAEAAVEEGEDLNRVGGGGGGGGGEESVTPEKIAGKINSSDDLACDSDERENRSFNESNSTSQRSEAKPNDVAEKKAEKEEVQPGIHHNNQSDPVQTEIRSEPNRGCSANGKVTDNDEEEKNDREKVEPSRPGELSGSILDSKRRVAATSSKQNINSSDVQSSAASLSRKSKRRRKGGDGVGSSSGEEPEGGEEVSPATTKLVKLVKLEPLVKVLSLVRSHRLGAVFQRRLRSQESQRYKNLIRQHIDLHVVQSRLDRGVYSDCVYNFFRDLLLVFNNGVVFFRKTTPEHAAALELRSLVLKEMNEQFISEPQPVVQTLTNPKMESDITTANTTATSVKPNKSSFVVCCRRRSINALSEAGNNNKGGAVKNEDKPARKGGTQEKIRGGGGGRRSRATNNKKKDVEVKTEEHNIGGNELSSHDILEEEDAKTDKKEEVKKSGAASFLRRMKQNGRKGSGGGNSSDVSEDESKDSIVDEGDLEEEEVDGNDKKRKNKAGKKKPETEEKAKVTRSSSGRGGRRQGGGGGQERGGGRAKKGVGRPLKKAETAAAGDGKRGRDKSDNGKADQVGSPGRPRKRTRR